ncbi:hypothetical protein [Deinococcus ruber]|uniref:hypothetical protein n=1 Tax=Deinococcus ruber TaxID=1848197 RepID=UPI0016631A92|nr:hypothetical protein [Deinococcus ruber]
MQTSSFLHFTALLFLIMSSPPSMLAASKPITPSQIMAEYGNRIIKSVDSGSQSLTVAKLTSGRSIDCREHEGKIAPVSKINLSVCVFVQIEKTMLIDMELANSGNSFKLSEIIEGPHSTVLKIEREMRLHALLLVARQKFGQPAPSSCSAYYASSSLLACTVLTKGHLAKIALTTSDGLNYYFDGVSFHALGKKPLPTLN